MDRQRFKADFDDALKVMWDFNRVVAEGQSPRRESQLPHGKGLIKNALVYIYAAIHQDATRALIEREFDVMSSARFLSKEFAVAVWTLIISLPEFLNDEEADIVKSFRDLHVPILPGPPDTLVERIATASHEMQARAMSKGQDVEAIAKIALQWGKIQMRIYEEGNAYFKEAQTFCFS